VIRTRNEDIGDRADAVFEGFRQEPPHPAEVGHVHIEGNTYLQVPSMNASIRTSPSVYNAVYTTNSSLHNTHGVEREGMGTDRRYGNVSSHVRGQNGATLPSAEDRRGNNFGFMDTYRPDYPDGYDPAVGPVPNENWQDRALPPRMAPADRNMGVPALTEANGVSGKSNNPTYCKEISAVRSPKSTTVLTITDDYEFAMSYFRAPPAAPLGPRGMLSFSVKYKEFIVRVLT